MMCPSNCQICKNCFDIFIISKDNLEAYKRQKQILVNNQKITKKEKKALKKSIKIKTP